MKKIPFSKSIQLFPTLCTTASMFCAFFSIIRSINGEPIVAAWAIFVASFFDMIDGRIARMTKTQSEFGKEYDSLVDLASFGMAPSILVYTWTLSQYHQVGWFLSFLFFACVALRLARFNVQVGVVEKKFFRGLPSPGAACFMAAFVLFSERFLGGSVRVVSVATLILVPLMALLMVSRIRYRSFKEFDVQKKNSFYVLIGSAIFLGVVSISPELVVFLVLCIYAFSGFVGELFLYQKQKPATEKTRSQTQKLSIVELQKKTSPHE